MSFRPDIATANKQPDWQQRDVGIGRSIGAVSPVSVEFKSFHTIETGRRLWTDPTTDATGEQQESARYADSFFAAN